MEKPLTKNQVVLGYHSPTEWVFFPEVVALYDSIIINQDVYEKTVDKGEKSLSGYEATKAELLKELKVKGVLQSKKYPMSTAQSTKLDSVVDYFFRNNESEIRRLIVYAFETFINHEKATLEKIVNPKDPHWKDVAAQLPRLERTKNEIICGTPLNDFPQQRNVVKQYLEDSIFIPADFKSYFNPVFQWEGYSRFEEFLLSYRRNKSKQKDRIKHGSEIKVFKSISEVLIPSRVIRTQKEMDRILKKWEAFKSIRHYVNSMNSEIWNLIEGFNESGELKDAEFVDDFNSFLSIKISNLNRQIEEVDLEVEQKKTTLFSKITRFLVATVGSIIPGTAGFSQILDDVHSNLVLNEPKEQYQDLRAIFEYESLLKTFKLSGKSISPFSQVSRNYSPVTYWDK